MKYVSRILLVVVLAGLMAAPPVFAKSHAMTMVPASFSDLAKEAKPGVVNIQTVKTIQGGGRVFQHFFGSPYRNQPGLEDFFGPFLRQQPQNRTERSLGSGFIIDKKGYIVTNNHVIKDADEIKVILHDNSEYKAKIIGADPMTDLALIKIDAQRVEADPLRIFGKCGGGLLGGGHRQSLRP